MRAWYEDFDYPAVLLWLGLVGIGLVAIYSATQGDANQYLRSSVGNNFERQLLWLAISAVCALCVFLVTVRRTMELAYVGYAVCVVLLIVALVAGREVGGARSWIALGPLSFQSSELAKLGALVAAARVVATSRRTGTLKLSLLLSALLLVPAILIILQNDTGTALVFIALIPVVLYWADVPLWVVALLVAPVLVGYLTVLHLLSAIGLAAVIVAGFHFAYRDVRLTLMSTAVSGGTVGTTYFALSQVLAPHQVARINAFANPEALEFRSGAGFHLMQSKAAVGSGGITGQGFMQGTQTQGAYIPEQSTDFIFSVIGEEFGFLGSIVLLALYAGLLIRLMQIATQISHPFGSMIAAGGAGMLLIQVLINTGMVLGLLPVIGIPLPLVSYGGSALLINTLLLALILNLHVRRKEFSLYV